MRKELGGGAGNFEVKNISIRGCSSKRIAPRRSNWRRGFSNGGDGANLEGGRARNGEGRGCAN